MTMDGSSVESSKRLLLSMGSLWIFAFPSLVQGWSLPLASNPTNVRNQWELPAQFGGVRIPGASISSHTFFDDDEEDHLYHGAYDSSRYGRTSSGSSSLQYFSNPPSGRVSRYNTGFVGRKQHPARSVRRSVSRPWATPALSMANYMQNGGPGSSNGNDRYNRNNYNNDNVNYNNNNNNNNNNYGGSYYDDYDEPYSRDGSYDYDSYQQPPPRRGGGPRGTNRYNTVGGVGSVNGSNLSREGRSMQFQNRRDSNMAGRAGRRMDDSFSQFTPDNYSRFESRPPNDAYARGGFRQDSKDGYWKDPNNYSNNNGPSYSNNPYSSTIPSNGFRPIPRNGDYISAPQYGYEPSGARGNVPYDNAYYYNNNNNNNNNGYGYRNENYEGGYESENDDYYSRNGNVIDNRRRNRGRGAPGGDENYFNLDPRDSNRRMDRGGGLMRYTPTQYDFYDEDYEDYYDSSGYLYNNEGKRVRRFDPDYDQGYYNPQHLSNDSNDPKRMVQNQRRRDGRDVQSGATLRRYDPEWDSNQGLYDEDSLYRSDVKGTRSYTDNRVMPRRRVNREDPSVLGDGWGETGGRGNQFGDYPRRGARKGLGRRDRDNEREYYRASDYPNLRGDDTMERFRQGKDVKKEDLYGYETGNTASGKKRIRNQGQRRGPRQDRGRPRPNSRGRDRGMSLDDLNEML